MRRYFLLLRNGPFARLWAASTVNAMGDAMTSLALIWLVLDRTGSARDVAVLVVAGTAPVIVGGFLMGSGLDRFRRTRFLQVVNAVLCVAVLSVPLAAWLGAGPSIPHLWAVAACYGFMKMANWAGVPSIMPSLVAEDDLTTANAMESISFGIAETAGPAIGGVLVALAGAAWVLVADGATYLVFVLALATLPAVAAGGQRHAQGLGLREALSFLRHDPPVRATTVMFMFAAMGEGMMLVATPVYVRESLHGGPETFGVLIALFAVAATIGSMATGAISWPSPFARTIAVCQVAAGLAYVPMIALPGVGLTAVTLVAAGVFGAPLTILAQTLRMERIPEGLRGRMFGLIRTTIQSAPPIGAAIAGIVVPIVGVRPVFLAVVVLIGLPGVIALVLPTLYVERSELALG